MANPGAGLAFLDEIGAGSTNTIITGPEPYHAVKVSQLPAFVQMPGGMATKVKAGVPSDTDFPTPPPDGTIVIDSANNGLYVRICGVWRSTTLT